jgi:phospholipid/cholesterol/gamma-HCH transport system ATP-binding protein
VSTDKPAISVENVTLAFGAYVVQRDVSFSITRGEIFVVMGDSGSGKSTMLRSMIGLLPPTGGSIAYGSEAFWSLDEDHRAEVQRRFGILFQSSALWSSMTLA